MVFVAAQLVFQPVRVVVGIGRQDELVEERAQGIVEQRERCPEPVFLVALLGRLERQDRSGACVEGTAVGVARYHRTMHTGELAAHIEPFLGAVAFSESPSDVGPAKRIAAFDPIARLDRVGAVVALYDRCRANRLVGFCAPSAFTWTAPNCICLGFSSLEVLGGAGGGFHWV